MTQTDFEASIFRYLYENLEVPYGIKIYEDKNVVDYTAQEEWVVIDSLTTLRLDTQPKALYFFHCAIQKGLNNGKEKLTRLLDKVIPLMRVNSRIVLYDYDSGDQIGEAEVCENSLSPILQHPGGGSFRSITAGVIYAA